MIKQVGLAVALSSFLYVVLTIATGEVAVADWNWIVRVFWVGVQLLIPIAVFTDNDDYY